MGFAVCCLSCLQVVNLLLPSAVPGGWSLGLWAALGGLSWAASMAVLTACPWCRSQPA